MDGRRGRRKREKEKGEGREGEKLFMNIEDFLKDVIHVAIIACIKCAFGQPEAALSLLIEVECFLGHVLVRNKRCNIDDHGINDAL